MTANEYLEKVVSQAYARELDQEENMVRSLPFAGAALALVVTILSLSRSYIPASLQSAYSISLWFLLIACAISIAASVCFLFFTIYRRRRFQYLSPAVELQAYVKRLRNYHEAMGNSPTDIDQRTFEDFQALMVDQYTVCATYNQQINFARNLARTRAFTSLIVAISLALAIVATISVHELFKEVL